MIRTLIALSLFLFAGVHSLYAGELLISKDTVWSGAMKLTEDVLILPGATLTIAPGTKVTVYSSETTRTEPEYLSSYTEITVRGNLKAEGSKEKPIIFDAVDANSDHEWAGLIVDGGKVSMSWCQVSGAESGLTVILGQAEVMDSSFSRNRYGVSILTAESKATFTRTSFQRNDYGLVLLNNGAATQQETSFSDNKQKDFLQAGLPQYRPEGKEYILPELALDAPYQSESLLGTVIWKNRVRVNGVVRIPATSRLIIMPGTVVEFTKNDTNEDGIGENGLLVMGMLVAKGTKEKPIIFRSAEKDRQAGDWDAINIYTSDGFQNILEHVQVEDAYRALHIHFSNVYVGNSVFRGNYRGMQFQESLVEVKGTEIYGNKSAIRARDSELRFVGNRVFDNYFGPNLYRITGEVSSNLFSGNLSDGLRVREGGLDVKENTILTNRYGLTVAYANFGSFHDNIISYNQEIGIALKGTDNIKVSRNFVQLNGVNGMSILTASAEIQGNHFADNGERGIGVISFKGLIEGNNFVNNGLYAIGLDGVSDISAPNNWWGSGVDMEKIIFDRKDKAGLGLVDYEMALEKPVAFTWPVPYVLVDTVWDGEIQILQRVDTSAGTTLRITPGTTVRFGIHRGMWANGNIEAIGTEKQRILFTRLNGTGDDHWHQIRVEKAQAVFDYCDFEYGETALHTHASDFRVVSTRFTHNQTGMMLCLGGTVVVNSSIFRENALGLVLNKARGEVRNTIIAENEVGIMVRAEDGRGMQISNSNIFSNARYNLKMGDFNKGENIDVRDNFWGTDKPGDTIFDDRIEPGLGRALFEPFAQQALEFTTN